MTALRHLLAQVRLAAAACIASAGVFARDVGNGLLEVAHNTLALLGLIAVAAVLFVGGRPDLRQNIESQTLDWLQAREEARTDPAELVAAKLAEPDAVARAT
ncbi:MAG TPA: lytic transglycosylase domain-containing protein, partial [Burkholderiales bacterium]